jgi:hypothetical protein
MNDRNLYRFPGCENLRLDCISDFVSVILSERINDTNYCLYEARRSGKIRSLFEKLSVAPSPSPQSRKAFYSMWATQGLWIREDRTIDDYLPAVLANFRLEYNGPPIEAFRGDRVATRYDKLAANYLAFIQLASVRLWLQVNESAP